MTIQTLKTDISAATLAFNQLNRRHYWVNKATPDGYKYRLMRPKTEAKLVALAERIARLHRFLSIMRARTKL